MNITISKGLKYAIFIGMLLLLMSIVYIYNSKTYLMEHSINLQTGGGTENCQRASGHLPFMGLYLCEAGYYQVAYPTHKKVFHYRYSSSELGPSIYTVFLEGADIKTFKVLNKYYSIDKDNLYFVDFGEFGGFEMIKTPHTNLSSMSVFNDAGKYAKDNDSVFFRGEKIYGVTPSDFKFFDGGQSVYGFRFALSDGKIFNGNKLVSAVIDGKFLVNAEGEELPFPCNNKQSVSPGRGYHYSPEGTKPYQYLHQCDITESGENEQIDIDTKTFRVINDNLYPYVKDKNYVYTCSAFDCSELHVLEGANPNTFNFGEVTPFVDYPPRDPHFYQNELIIERNGYILGCKVYEGFESDPVKKIERGDTDDNSDLCEYFIYSTTE